MKKLNLLVLPLMAISFLTNCGGGSTPSEDVKFSIQESSVTLKKDNTIKVHLDWTPTNHSIEFSNFTFTLDSGSTTATVTPGTVGDRPLELTVTFASKLSTDDKGDLKFHYNDKTAEREGEGKVNDINIKVVGEKPSFSVTDSTVDYDDGTHSAMVELNWEPESDSITFSNLNFVYDGGQADEVTAETTTSSPTHIQISFGDAGLDEDVTGNLSFEYTDTTTGVTGVDEIKNITIDVDEPTPPVTTYHISMVTDGTDIEEKELPTEENYVGTISVTANKKILNGISSIKLEGGTPITSYEYEPSADFKSAQLTLYAPFTDNIEVAVNLIDEPEAKGTIKWTNYDGSLLVDAYQLPVGVTATYEGPTPIQPKDDTYVHRFTGWSPDPTKTPVTQGDNVFNAVYDDVPITDAGAEFKIVIPATNADKTFTFTCDGTEKLTVDWGDTTVDNNNSHTYSESGTYVVSLYRDDITNVNVTDSTSKSYIKEIDFKDKITSTNEYAFFNCPSLTSVNIPSGLTSIGVNTFEDCSALSTILVASGNSKYDSRNNCNAIIETATNTLIKGCEATSIPNTVTAIGDNAFKNCSGLGSIGIPDSVTTIGDNAFRGCASMTVVSLDQTFSSLTSIGDNAFRDCGGLLFFAIPDKLLTIGNYAFSGCSKLANVSCSSDAVLTSIGDYAFGNCTSLSSIDIPDSITSVGMKAFYNCPLTYTTENNCEYLASKSGNKYLILTKAVNYSIDSVTINNSCKIICGEAFFGCGYLVDTINIPDSVTYIGERAFYSCYNLTEVKINNSSNLVTISEYAFCGCSQLTTINIPNKVTFIGEEAFYTCIRLETVDLANFVEEDANKIPSLGKLAFDSCLALTTLKVANANMAEIFKKKAGWSAYADLIKV